MATFAALVALSTLSLGTGSAVDTPLRVLPGHFGNVAGLVFSSDGETLATASGDVQFWDVSSGSLLRKFSDFGNQAYAVDLSPDGSLFATGTMSRLGGADDYTPDPPLMEAKIWDYSQGSVLHTFGLDKLRFREGVRAVAFSPDGTMLAVGGADHEEHLVRLFDVSTGAELQQLAEGGLVTDLAFNRAGTLLAKAQPNRIELWNLTTFELAFPKYTITGNRGEKTAFSPDGKLLAYGSDDKSLRVVSVETAELVMKLDGHDQNHDWGYVFSVAFSPDGSVLASGSGDTTIILWKVSDGTKLRTIAGHNGYVCSLAFSPDGTKLVSGADEEEVKIWDVSDIIPAVATDAAPLVATTTATGTDPVADANCASSRVALLKVVSAVLVVGCLWTPFAGSVA